jgi:hypothetical protein
MMTKDPYLRPGYVLSKDIDESAMTEAERQARLEQRARICMLTWDDLTLEEQGKLYSTIEYMVRQQFQDLLRDVKKIYPSDSEADILQRTIQALIDLHDKGLLTFSMGGGKFNMVATCHLERGRC